MSAVSNIRRTSQPRRLTTAERRRRSRISSVRSSSMLSNSEELHAPPPARSHPSRSLVASSGGFAPRAQACSLPLVLDVSTASVPRSGMRCEIHGRTVAFSSPVTTKPSAGARIVASCLLSSASVCRRRAFERATTTIPSTRSRSRSRRRLQRLWRVDEDDVGTLAQRAQDAPERGRGDELARVRRDRARRQHLEETRQLAGPVAVPVPRARPGARARACRRSRSASAPPRAGHGRVRRS